MAAERQRQFAIEVFVFSTQNHEEGLRPPPRDQNKQGGH
jgi:hypothetical protein